MEALEDRTLLASFGLPVGVSVNETGTATGNDSSSTRSRSVSANGRYQVFSSYASNLVPGDTNSNSDVFLRDLVEGTTTLVSVNSTNSGSGNSFSGNAVISANGRYVAFESSAQDLTDITTDGQQNIYLRDLVTGVTTLISLNSSGTGGGNEYSVAPTIGVQPGGQVFVAYSNSATDLVEGFSDGNYYYQQDVYLRDVSTGATRLVSVNSTGTARGNNWSYNPLLSRDGSVLTFESYASDLVSGINDTNSSADLFVHRIGGQTKYISVDSTGLSAANGGSWNASLSWNGRTIAFESHASNLVSNDTNGSIADIFVRSYSDGRLETGVTELISVNSASTGSGNGSSYSPSISGDGRYVAFLSTAYDLDPDFQDYSYSQNVYVRDRHPDTARTTLISVNSDGTKTTNSYLYRAEISGNGQFVAFEGFGTDLVEFDTGGVSNIFLRDWLADSPSTILVSRNSLGTSGGNNFSYSPSLSDNGTTLIFESYTNDLLADVTDLSPYAGDIFAYSVLDGSLQLVSAKGSGLFTGRNGSYQADLSDNGQFIAFASYSSGLITHDTNGDATDVFVKNLSTGTMELVSVNSAGTGSGSWYSSSPSISGDGRYVAFLSTAHDLDPDFENYVYSQNVYVRDRDPEAGRTTLISVNSEGTAQGSSDSYSVNISGNGQIVSFLSYARDLVEINTDGGYGNIYVRDWLAVNPITTLVTQNSLGTSGGNAHSYQPFLSDNGTTLVFESHASNLLASSIDTNGTWDVFAVRAIGLAIDNVALVEGNSGTTVATFTVSLLSPSSRTVRVNYATTDGTATAASGDYQAAIGILTFEAGETEKTVTVLVNGDMTPELDESFFVDLSNPSNADLSVRRGVATIRNDIQR